MSNGARPQSLPLLEVVKASAEYLTRHGVESSRLNAEHLAAHVLGKRNRIDLYLEFDRPLGPRELDPMRELVRRRGKGEPLQHLLGTVEFHGREFRCDRRALVPRPETEQLVELVLARIPAETCARFLDVGTGSGIIALTLATERPTAEVVACDRSPEALALARENSERHALSGRMVFCESDLLSNVAGIFTGIVANLPYIPATDLPALAREVQHDPAQALDGGADGLALIRRLIESAPAHLEPAGWMALEIGHDQADRVEELFAARGYRAIASTLDYQGVARFVCAGAPP